MIEENAVALVTGAATGIGLATAEAFADAGYDLVVSDRDEQRGAAAARELESFGGKVAFIACDVSVPEQVRHLHEEAQRLFGRLDAACNNAGIEGQEAPAAESSLDNFDLVLGINLRGVFLCMREQLRIMLPQGTGSIVNVASVAGLVGIPGLSAYCASKGGVLQLTRAAALEYAAQGVRINAICPGAVRTEMMARVTRHDPAQERAFAALHPMERMGYPREVAEAVVWLSSPQASFVTGTAMPIDGGYTGQ